jgi:multidrug efflux pump subunit AcrA (membrane-fusion protein)
VNNKGVAKSRELTLGPVYGQFVQVETGLGAGDRVIVNRNVIEGDKVVEE